MAGTGLGTKNINDLIKRADDLIALGTKAVALARDGGFGIPSVPHDSFSEFKSASVSFLDRTFGEGSAYPTQFRKEVGTDTLDVRVKHGIGILRAVRDEMAGGWVVTTRGLISAEVFADFLEMAEHLLDEHYYHAAAVMIGSVLEEHLRQLAITNGVDIEELKQNKMVPRKADVINADLTKNQIYDKLDQKSVTAWLDLRNKAAHGKYSEYTEEQVRIMLTAIREFMGRVRI
jgi:hypothetical protein